MYCNRDSTVRYEEFLKRSWVSFSTKEQCGGGRGSGGGFSPT